MLIYGNEVILGAAMNKHFFVFVALPSRIDDDGTCVINSWKKSIRVFVLFSLVNALFFILISNILFRIANEESLFKFIIIALPIVFIMNLVSIYFSLRKNRLEMDSSGLTVYLDKKTHIIDWQDVTGVELSKQKRSGTTRAGDYYKVFFDDKTGYPFNDILVEKTDDIEMDLSRYYKVKSDNF